MRIGHDMPIAAAAGDNGGGHYNAAAFAMAKPLDEAKQELLEIFSGVIYE